MPYQYLILESDDPAQNRRRRYGVSVNEFSGEGIYQVILSWGRVGHRMRNKTAVYEHQEGVIKYLQGILKKRIRHGYVLRERSEAFPPVAILDGLEIAVVQQGGQMRLF